MINVPTRILGLLRIDQTECHTDEEIMRLVGIASHGALKVHITALRAQGHVVERVYKTGYRLGPSRSAASSGGFMLRGVRVVKGEKDE